MTNSIEEIRKRVIPILKGEISDEDIKALAISDITQIKRMAEDIQDLEREVAKLQKICPHRKVTRVKRDMVYDIYHVCTCEICGKEWRE